MINVKKELKNLEKHLRTRPDDKIVNGYKRAKEDYEATGDNQKKIAMDMIKSEAERRGLDVEYKNE